MKALLEPELLDLLDSSSRVFLLEPGYKRKYPPLGLMKIAGRVRRRGGLVKYARVYKGETCDVICCSSLFSHDYDGLVASLRQTEVLASGKPIVVGGPAATLMKKKLTDTFQSDSFFVFGGYSKALDQEPPDYSLEWQIDKPWDEFAFVFTSRGCPNKCAYCAVWRIEPGTWINPRWKECIPDTKANVMVSDNNLSALDSDHIVDVLSWLAGSRRGVVFDNGFDVKHITSDMAKRLAQLKFTRSGMRVAFDRIEEDGIFQRSIELMKSAGVPSSQMMAYVLFNFKDTPREADYRARECVKLGVRPYPQRYEPLSIAAQSRKYIGKHWTPGLVKLFRNFWLLAGIYTKDDFGEWLRWQRDVRSEDIEAWERSKRAA